MWSVMASGHSECDMSQSILYVSKTCGLILLELMDIVMVFQLGRIGLRVQCSSITQVAWAYDIGVRMTHIHELTLHQ